MPRLVIYVVFVLGLILGSFSPSLLQAVPSKVVVPREWGCEGSDALPEHPVELDLTRKDVFKWHMDVPVNDVFLYPHTYGLEMSYHENSHIYERAKCLANNAVEYVEGEERHEVHYYTRTEVSRHPLLGQTFWIYAMNRVWSPRLRFIKTLTRVDFPVTVVRAKELILPKQGGPRVNIILSFCRSGEALEEKLADFISSLQKLDKREQFRLIIGDASDRDVGIEYLRVSGLDYMTLHLGGGSKKGRKPCQNFDKKIGINRAAAQVTNPDEIVLLMDVDMRLPRDFISRVQQRCIQGEQAYAPVVFGADETAEHLLQDESARPFENGWWSVIRGLGVQYFLAREDKEKKVISSDGFWRVGGFGVVAMYGSDWKKIGGLRPAKNGKIWGYEDIDFMNRVMENGLRISRPTEPSYYHEHHPPYYWKCDQYCPCRGKH